MAARIYVTRLGPAVSEGCWELLALLDRLGSLRAISAQLACDPGLVGRWLRGAHRPGAQARIKLSRLGIPVECWDRPPTRPFSLSAHAA